MSVCEQPKTDTIVFTKGNWFARRLWKQAPSPERLWKVQKLPSVVIHMPLPCWKERHLPNDRPRPCCVDSGGSTTSSHVVLLSSQFCFQHRAR